MPTTDKKKLNYQRVSSAISYLLENSKSQPKLEQIAKHVGISPFHLQRVFSEWSGVSPKQFLQYLTKEYAKKELRQASIFDCALSAGLSSASRLHDLFLTHECVTPGEFRTFGDGLELIYGMHNTIFGLCFIVTSHRGIVKLAFVEKTSESDKLVTELNNEWKFADIRQDQHQTATLITQIFSLEFSQQQPLHVILKGSPFQLKVWEALLNVPCGRLCSYQDIATHIGKPAAVRATASAIANNQIAYLIPCHRVIRSTGVLSNYRWGKERKAAMIGWEQSQKQISP